MPPVPPRRSALAKSVSPSTPAYGAAGDVINYNYLVTNTGTTTESNISVSDNKIATVSCPPGSLAPGASETCTGSYTVTQADVDTGSVTNSATASSTNPQAVVVTSSAFRGDGGGLQRHLGSEHLQVDRLHRVRSGG